jgi:hypothetical protein
MWQNSWAYSDELQMLQNDQLVLAAIRTIETNGFFNPVYTNLLNRMNGGSIEDKRPWTRKWDVTRFYPIFFTGEAGDFAETIGTAMAVEASRQIVITAIALKLYQLKQGNYPPDLHSLVPEYVATVPLDPADGKPLRYRLKADGTFLLYSIGVDGKDDNGNPSSGNGYSFAPPAEYYWTNPDNQDWVWPQPATPAEVQYFYDHPPKY